MAINLLRRRREKIRKQNILDDALNEYDEFEIREEDLINAEPTKDMTAQVNIPIFYLTNGTMKEKLEKLINAENQTPVQVCGFFLFQIISFEEKFQIDFLPGFHKIERMC